MADVIKAFIEFLVDLFSALSEFLGGKTFDISTIADGLLGGGDDEETKTEE